MVPIALTVTSKKIFQRAFGRVDRFDLHSSTFAGNALACSVAMQTLEILQRENLMQNSAERGEQLLQGLRANLSSHPFIKEIRGQGLFVAIEFADAMPALVNHLLARAIKIDFNQIYGQWIALKLLETGIVCQPAASAWNVLKLMPPLTITEYDTQWAIEHIAQVLNEYQSASKVSKETTARMLRRTPRRREDKVDA